MSVPHLTPVVEAPTAAAAAAPLRRRGPAPVGRPTGRADRAVRRRPAAERRGDRRRRGRRRAAVRPRVGLPQPRDARGARPRPPHAPRARPGPLRARRPPGRPRRVRALRRVRRPPARDRAAIRAAVRDAVGFEPFFHHFPLAGLCPAAPAPATRPTDPAPSAGSRNPRVRPATPAGAAATRAGAGTWPIACGPDERARTIAAARRATGAEKETLDMSKGFRLRAIFSVLRDRTARLH